MYIFPLLLVTALSLTIPQHGVHPPTSLQSTSASRRNFFSSNVGVLSLLNIFPAQPANAGTVAPLADVGLREFLVKDSKALLRLSLPSTLPLDLPNDPGRRAQEAVELVRLRLEQVGFSGKPAVWSACAKEVATAISIVSGDILEGVPARKMKEASELQEAAKSSLNDLRDAVKDNDIAKTLAAQDRAANEVYRIRLLAMKPGLPYNLPSELSSYPKLVGRATIRMEIARGGSSEGSKPLFTLDDDTKSPSLPLTIIVDGYRAPITAGHFVTLVNKKNFDGAPVFGENELFVNVESKVPVTTKIPLELFYKKDAAPTYHYTSDDDLRATEAFADPFQAVGAMGFIHDPEEPDTASGQFFFLKWSQALVAPGRNTLDGSSACFAYVTQNYNALEQVKQGDVIVKAVVVEGGEYLK